MRRYDDPVEVRKGMVPGSGGEVEGPEQFLWRGRLWKVSDVVGHWVETGPWWQSSGVAAVLGADEAAADRAEETADGGAGRTVSVHDLVAGREVWRVEAGRGLVAASGAGGAAAGRGVFDLAFDWDRGGWLLTRCAD